MHNQKKVLTDYRSILSLTSLTAAEFLEILVPFDELWQRYHTHYDLKGNRRRIQKFREHGSMSLQGSLDKLFFVLVFLKQNPLQHYQGFCFGMSQGKVSQWLQVLLPILEQALHRLQMLPSREPSHFYLSLRLLAGQVLLLDATERAIPRSIDAERQRHEYSGKKGGHTLKNLLVSQPQNCIVYLSATVAGSMHDKAMADEMELQFLPEQCLLLDLGFVGYEPEGAQKLLPVKKPPLGELTAVDKGYNRLLASVRVKVEHVMAGVKRIRIVKDKIRLHGEQIRDLVMLIACGLHNLRIAHRNLS
ncbi:MAG: transposase family protein [Adhaeribacter sp.]